ncbi:MAG: helix-turn-helix domain-containing protein [Fimbriimonas sp.]
MSVERTSGSVFAALGYEDSEEMERKSELVSAISETIRAKGLSQVEAARIVNLDQPTLSKLLRGRTRSISMDKLTAILNALGRDVTIIVGRMPADGAKGRTLVEVR